jgi:hypothetical protein
VDEQARVAFVPVDVVPAEVDGVGVVGEGAEVEEEGVIGREGEGVVGDGISCMYVSQSLQFPHAKHQLRRERRKKTYS